MNFRNLIKWPWPIRVSAHLRKVGDLLANPNPRVVLSDAETWRAAQIRPVVQRNAFVASRRFAREVLSAPFGCAPEAVPNLSEFNHRPPALRGRIRFNSSHCQEWCALAWSTMTPIGVDVEVIRPVLGMGEIVSDFFPPNAQWAFHAAGYRDRTAVFFRWWAQIAAALKASGGDLDDTYTCLDRVSHEVCDAIPGVVLAVAAADKAPLAVTWHLPEKPYDGLRPGLPSWHISQGV